MIQSIKSSDNYQWLLKTKRKSSLPAKFSLSNDSAFEYVKRIHLSSIQDVCDNSTKQKVNIFF